MGSSPVRVTIKWLVGYLANHLISIQSGGFIRRGFPDGSACRTDMGYFAETDSCYEQAITAKESPVRTLSFLVTRTGLEPMLPP